MKRILRLTAAAVVALAPMIASAAPPASGSISPAHDTSQPSQSCEELGNQPGQSANAPGEGSAFVDEEDSIAGGHYAGSQEGINDKNTASVSQYDVACLHNQSHRR